MPSIRLIMLVLAAAAATLALPASSGAAAWTPATGLMLAGTQPAGAISSRGLQAIAVTSPRGIGVAVRAPGHRWGRAATVSRAGYAVRAPSVVVSPAGEVLVAWTQAASRAGSATTRGPITIRVAVRSARGRWAAPQLVGTSGHFNDARPQLAINARGEAIVLWRGLQRTGARRRTEAVQSAWLSPGHRFGRAQTIREPESPRGIADTSVVLDARGTAVAVWTNDRGPVVRIAARSRGAGGSWHAARPLGAAPASRPVLALAPDRSVNVAWRRAGADSEGDGLQTGALLAATRTASGRLSATQEVSATPTRDYRLVVAAAGEALLAFSPAHAESVPPVLLTTIRARGAAAFAAPQPAGSLVPTGVAYLASGEAVVLGSDAAGGVSALVRAPGGAFGAPEQLAPSAVVPQLAAAGARMLAIWGVPNGDVLRIAGATRG